MRRRSVRPAARWRQAALVALAGLVVLALGNSGVATATRLVPLTSDVLRGINLVHPSGPTSPSQRIGIGIQLSRDEAAIASYIRGEYTPGSPTYHQFLSPAAFNRRFGVSAKRLAAAEAWARGGGLKVQSIPGTTDYFLAGGTVGQVSALLKVKFDNYRYRYGYVYANQTAPKVPADLGIAGISGLNDVEGPHLMPGIHLRHGSPSGKRRATPDPNMATGLTTPSDLWSIYDQPSGNKGEGQAMAIFGWGLTTNTESDLRIQEAQFKLPAIDYKLDYFGTETKVTDASGEGEWDLDTQAASGMAPDATGLHLYFGKAGTDPDLIAAYKAWVNDPAGPLQGSSSFSGCEQVPGTDSFTGGPGSPSGLLFLGNPNQDQYTAALQQAVAEGRTMFASAGDTGSGCPAIALELNGYTLVPTPEQGFPAVSPYAVGVGGTVLFWDHGSADTSGQPASRALEYGWPYTGGGSSPVLAAGAYQTSFTPPILLFHCLTDNHGNPYPLPPPLCRGIPDVAAQSGDVFTGNGYSITSNGATGSFGGGTSLSSPLWLGMWTRIQAASSKVSSHGVHGNGFANPAFYGTAGTAGTSPDFFDIGGASTDTAITCNGPQPYQCSHPGWDYVSGLGSPDVTKLMTALDGSTTPVNPTTPNPPPSGSGSGTTPPISCGPLWSDQSVDEQVPNAPNPVTTGLSPQLDLEGGTITPSADGKSLTTTLRIINLNSSSGGGSANEYYMEFQYGKTNYYTNVEVQPTGTVYYSDGTDDPTTGFSQRSGTDTGSYKPGKDGTVSVTIPVSALAGNAAKLPAPGPGSILAGIQGVSGVLVGVPQNAVASAGEIFYAEIDTANAAYQWPTRSCTTPPPPVPVLSHLTIAPGTFVVAPSNTSSKGGTTVSYDDTLAANATLAVYRWSQHKFVYVGSFTHHDHAGLNQLRFNGRLGGKPLAPGQYVLNIVSVLNGKRSNKVGAWFKVKANCDYDWDGDCDKKGQG